MPARHTHDAMATLAAFIRSCLDDGVPIVGAAPLADGLTLGQELADSTTAWCLMMPGGTLHPAAAGVLWGWHTLAVLSQALLHRYLEVGEIDTRLALASEPERTDPAMIAGVDVALHLLPIIAEQAAHLSAEDPVLSRITAIAERWPLSGVGIAGASGTASAVLLEHPLLSQWYGDRILSRDDDTRIIPDLEPFLRAAVRRHPQLAPRIARALEVVSQ